jgi:hypothetical protein
MIQSLTIVPQGDEGWAKSLYVDNHRSNLKPFDKYLH